MGFLMGKAAFTQKASETMQKEKLLKKCTDLLEPVSCKGDYTNRHMRSDFKNPSIVRSSNIISTMCSKNKHIFLSQSRLFSKNSVAFD